MSRRAVTLPKRHLRRTNAESQDRKSTRLNSSHITKSYAVFCLKKNALDDFEEDRPDHVLGEDLQQQALPFGRCAVHQDAALLQFGEVLGVALDALGQQLVLCVGRSM